MVGVHILPSPEWIWDQCISVHVCSFQMHTNTWIQIDPVVYTHVAPASCRHTHTVTLTLTIMQTNKWTQQCTHISTHTPSHINTHSLTHTYTVCLPAGFASPKGGNTSFNQTGQLRTNFSFVVTAWGPKGLQSLYWQSAAHKRFLQKLFNNLVWILIRTLTLVPQRPVL